MELSQGKRLGDRFKVTASLGHVEDGTLLLAQDRALGDIEVGLRLWKKDIDSNRISTLFELCSSQHTHALPQAFELLELASGPALTFQPPPADDIKDFLSRYRPSMAAVAWVLYQLVEAFQELCSKGLAPNSLGPEQIRVAPGWGVQLSLFESESRECKESQLPYRDLGSLACTLLEKSLSAPFSELCQGCEDQKLLERWSSPKPGEVLLGIAQRLQQEGATELSSAELLAELHFALYELQALAQHPKRRSLHP
jgi:hypothetical protein